METSKKQEEHPTQKNGSSLRLPWRRDLLCNFVAMARACMRTETWPQLPVLTSTTGLSNWPVVHQCFYFCLFVFRLSIFILYFSMLTDKHLVCSHPHHQHCLIQQLVRSELPCATRVWLMAEEGAEQITPLSNRLHLSLRSRPLAQC